MRARPQGIPSEWTLAAATRAGSRNTRLGRACQDRASVRRLPGGILIAALADGAGSAAHGRQGAEAAVAASLRVMTAALGRCPAPDLAALGQSVLDTAAQAVPDRDHGCTLIAFAATAHALLVVQVGDGALVVRPADGAPYQRAIPRLPVEHVNETSLLGTPDWRDGARVVVLPPAPFVCALTDGLEDLAIRRADDTPHPGFFEPLDRYAAAIGADRPARAAVRRFLAEPRIAARTDDDLGLILAARRSV